MRFPIFFLLTTSALGVAPAYAHWGHLGELGGHGHWIGIGALLGAAAVAAALRRFRKPEEVDAEPAGEEIETEGETA